MVAVLTENTLNVTPAATNLILDPSLAEWLMTWAKFITVKKNRFYAYQQPQKQQISRNPIQVIPSKHYARLKLMQHEHIIINNFHIESSLQAKTIKYWKNKRPIIFKASIIDCELYLLPVCNQLLKVILLLNVEARQRSTRCIAASCLHNRNRFTLKRIEYSSTRF